MEAIRASLSEIKKIVLDIRNDLGTLLDRDAVQERSWAEIAHAPDTVQLIARPITVTAIRFSGDMRSARYIQRTVQAITEYAVDVRLKAGYDPQTLGQDEYMKAATAVILTNPLGQKAFLPTNWWVIIDDNRTVIVLDDELTQANYFAPRSN